MKVPVSVAVATAAIAGFLRVGPEIVDIPARRVNPMRPRDPDAMTAAEAKRMRKMAKRAKETS